MSLQRDCIAESVPRRSGPAQYPIAGADPIAIANFVDRVLSHVSSIRISECMGTPTSKYIRSDTIHQRPIYGLTFPRLSHIVKEGKGKPLVNNEDLIAVFFLAVLLKRYLYYRNLQVTMAGYEIYMAGRRLDHVDDEDDKDAYFVSKQVNALEGILAGKDAPWNPDDRKFVTRLWDELVLSAHKIYQSSRVTYASLTWVREVLRVVKVTERR